MGMVVLSEFNQRFIQTASKLPAYQGQENKAIERPNSDRV